MPTHIGGRFELARPTWVHRVPVFRGRGARVHVGGALARGLRDALL